MFLLLVLSSQLHGDEKRGKGSIMKNPNNRDSLLNAQMAPDTGLSIVHELSSLDDLIYLIEFPTGNQGGTLIIPILSLNLEAKWSWLAKWVLWSLVMGKPTVLAPPRYKALGLCCFISSRWRLVQNTPKMLFAWKIQLLPPEDANVLVFNVRGTNGKGCSRASFPGEAAGEFQSRNVGILGTFSLTPWDAPEGCGCPSCSLPFHKDFPSCLLQSRVPFSLDGLWAAVNFVCV